MSDAARPRPGEPGAGRPFEKGKSGNPGGRPKHERVTAYAGLVASAGMIAEDPALTDAEKVQALLGVCRAGFALMRRYQRNGTKKPAVFSTTADPVVESAPATNGDPQP